MFSRLPLKIMAILLAFMFVFITVMPVSTPAQQKQAPQKEFTVAWSIYVGWMPWPYADHAGILKKWADKYGIKIKLVRMDYIPSVEAFVSKKADACVMTNMECLDMPSASGIDATIVVNGDYSNGNDAILTRDGIGIKDLPGLDIFLVELSVSHYTLARCLEMNGMKEKQVNLFNTSDSDIGPAYITNKSQKVVVTWNPIVMEILQNPGITKIFDSSQIPGEILDLMIVRTEVLEKHPELGKALVGAWYEVMSIMSQRGPAADSAMAYMASLAGCSLAEYKAQLKTTAMFWKPQDAVNYTESQEMKDKMNLVRQFCFQHNLLGENARSVDEVGILYPDGSVQGDKKNIKMRFTTEYMRLAAEGKL